MLRRIITASMLLAAAMMVVTAQADDSAAKSEKKFEARCPISGGKAKQGQSCKYKEGEVYFCCGKCKAAFAKDSKKHAVKANAQLVQTGQYVQKGCPMSGGPMKKESKIGGIAVKFCCGNCKKAADKAEGDEALALVFSDKAFAKGFEKKKKEEKKDSEG